MNKESSASLGYPLSVFNKNSTLKPFACLWVNFLMCTFDCPGLSNRSEARGCTKNRPKRETFVLSKTWFDGYKGAFLECSQENWIFLTHVIRILWRGESYILIFFRDTRFQSFLTCFVSLGKTQARICKWSHASSLHVKSHWIMNILANIFRIAKFFRWLWNNFWRSQLTCYVYGEVGYFSKERGFWVQRISSKFLLWKRNDSSVVL